MNTLDGVLAALVALALIAVVVSKNATTASAISSGAGSIASLLKTVMNPLAGH
jgi:hypothetical protein